MGRIAELGAVSKFVIERLREIRLRQGLTAGQLAQRAGIPASSYICLEGGRYRLHFDNLFRALLALGESITAVWPMADGERVGEVTDEIVRERVGRAEAQLGRPPGIDDVIRAVCRVCKVELSALQGEARSRPISEARGIAAILTHEQPRLTLNKLAQALHKNPASLTHSKKSVSKQMEGNPRLRECLDQARGMLKNRRSAEAQGRQRNRN